MSLLKLTDVGMLYGGRVPALEHINLTVEKRRLARRHGAVRFRKNHADEYHRLYG